MSFFKTKVERDMMEQMQRDEQIQVFNDQINELKTKRQEYAKVAAEAEVNGDSGTYEVAVNALIELNDVISSLTQSKANFDVINISNSIATNMAMAINVLDTMAGNKAKLPDIKKIQKVHTKINNYMRNIKISQKSMGNVMRTSNPANKARSTEEIASVRPMIDAEISRLVGKSASGLNSKNTEQQGQTASSMNMDLSSEILAEKNRII